MLRRGLARPVRRRSPVRAGAVGARRYRLLVAVFVREGPRQLALDGFRPEPAQHAEAEAARFAAKVVADPRPGGCAHWIGAIGAIGNDGYGRFQAGTGPTARTVRPHLWVVEAAHGLRPVRVLVLHACDETGCVALEHLRLGTQAQNVAQMHARGRRGRRHTAAVDLRGPAGRARAIRVALAEGWDEDAFSAALAAGDPRSRQLALPAPLAVGSRSRAGRSSRGSYSFPPERPVRAVPDVGSARHPSHTHADLAPDPRHSELPDP